MAFNAGVTRLVKKRWFDAIDALSTLKIAIYSTTTGLDCNTDPATPLAYTTSNELTSSGTGYTAGGYAVNLANSATGNGYQLTAADVVTGTGTIASGTYGAMIYDTADSNNAVAICTVTISTGSVAGTMTLDLPVDCIKVI